MSSSSSAARAAASALRAVQSVAPDTGDDTTQRLLDDLLLAVEEALTALTHDGPAPEPGAPAGPAAPVQPGRSS